VKQDITSVFKVQITFRIVIGIYVSLNSTCYHRRSSTSFSEVRLRKCAIDRLYGKLSTSFEPLSADYQFSKHSYTLPLSHFHQSQLHTIHPYSAPIRTPQHILFFTHPTRITTTTTATTTTYPHQPSRSAPPTSKHSHIKATLVNYYPAQRQYPSIRTIPLSNLEAKHIPFLPLSSRHPLSH